MTQEQYDAINTKLDALTGTVSSLAFMAQEQQQFRLYRNPDTNSPTYGWVVLVGPGMAEPWHVPNDDYVAGIQHFRLAGAVIDVPGNDNTGNWFDFVMSMYKLTAPAAADSEKLLAALDAIKLGDSGAGANPLTAEQIIAKLGAAITAGAQAAAS